MRKAFIVLCFTLHVTIVFAQKEIMLFRTSSGAIYTQMQHDSILTKGGVAISRIDKEKRGDTTFINISVEKLVTPDIVKKFEGKSMPDFIFLDINKNEYRIKNLRGYVLYINFWSTSCSPCVIEIPDLNKLKNLYKNQKVLFLGIAPESAQELKEFLIEHPFDFKIVSNNDIFEGLGIDSYPVNFFIDKKGIIKKISTGTPMRKNEKTKKWEVSVIDSYSDIINQLL